MRDTFATIGIASFSVMFLGTLYNMVRPPTLCEIPGTVHLCAALFIAFVGLVVSFLALRGPND